MSSSGSISSRSSRGAGRPAFGGNLAMGNNAGLDLTHEHHVVQPVAGESEAKKELLDLADDAYSVIDGLPLMNVEPPEGRPSNGPSFPELSHAVIRHDDHLFYLPGEERPW